MDEWSDLVPLVYDADKCEECRAREVMEITKADWLDDDRKKLALMPMLEAFFGAGTRDFSVMYEETYLGSRRHSTVQLKMTVDMQAFLDLIECLPKKLRNRWIAK